MNGGEPDFYFDQHHAAQEGIRNTLQSGGSTVLIPITIVSMINSIEQLYTEQFGPNPDGNNEGWGTEPDYRLAWVQMHDAWKIDDHQVVIRLTQQVEANLANFFHLD